MKWEMSKANRIQIGWEFVKSYYTILNKDPSKLHVWIPFLFPSVLMITSAFTRRNQL
jgi:hypothetical protein